MAKMIYVLEFPSQTLNQSNQQAIVPLDTSPKTMQSMREVLPAVPHNKTHFDSGGSTFLAPKAKMVVPALLVIDADIRTNVRTYRYAGRSSKFPATE